MKKLLLLISLTLFALSTNWQSDINKALNLAKKENKMLLVFIEAKGCGYCQKMKEDIFNNKQTVKALEKDYILVKMDISKAAKLFPGTYVTPTTYIFRPNKELLASEVGYQNEEFFFWTLGEAEQKFKEIKGK